MTALAWAIALSVLSAIAYAAAAVAQAHYADTRRGVRRWAVPLLLTGIGAGLHVIALRYGAVGVVQALGALTLIFALPLAAWRTRQRVSATAWRHSWSTVGGLAVLLTLTTAGSGTLSATSTLWLPIGTAAAVAALTFGAHLARSPLAQGLLLAGGAGAAFGVSSVLTKTVLTSGSFPVLSVVAIGGLAAVGQFLSQRAYGRGGLAVPLAAVSVTNPVVAGVVGIALLGDSVHFGATGAVFAVIAAILTARGIIGLTTHESASTSHPRAQDQPRALVRGNRARWAPIRPSFPETGRELEIA